MTPRIHLRPAPSALALVVLLILVAVSGCGDSATAPPAVDPSAASTDPADAQVASGAGRAGFGGSGSDVGEGSLIDAIMHLTRTAATNPGGDNFNIVKDHLNEIFAEARPGQFAMSDQARDYLLTRFGDGAERALSDLENPSFTFRDSRHIEDCLLLSTIANRVAGNGEDLDRVRRVFDWLVRQVQLVPPGSLAPQGLPQAEARPYDVLLRGMATEQGSWAERSWAFIALCRQIGIDAGMVLYTPKESPTEVEEGESAEPTLAIWICAVLIDGTAYLFDCSLGMPLPGPGGVGIATLAEAMSDPSVLEQLDLPSRPYIVKADDLAGNDLRIWIDSTLGSLSTRMRELQKKLVGRNRMVLYRDPSEVHEAFARALGDQFADTGLWPMPMEVEYKLFNNPNFVTSTQYALAMFDASLPLLPTRMAQLTGDLGRAIESYANFRFAQRPVQNDGETPIPPPIQEVLDLYATYYLALGKIDQGEPGQAELFFRQTLRMSPQPGTSQMYASMFQWGAHTNLGLLSEARGDQIEAIRHYAAGQPTFQDFGNRLRARALIWNAPFDPDTPPNDGRRPARTTASTAPRPTF